jgi:membrane-bound lytic murein transglycosylase B
MAGEVIDLKPRGVADAKVDQAVAAAQQSEQTKEKLEEMRLALMQARMQMEPFANDPWFKGVKRWARQSGITDATGQPGMVAVTAAEAMAELDKALEKNLQELKAADGGVVLLT